jgi:outer membrane protein OmpA-like peptidoglycan-associated protein
MMKKQTLFGLAATFLMGVSTLNAQSDKYGVYYRFLAMDYVQPQTGDFLKSGETSKGAEIGVTRRLAKNLHLNVPIRIGVADGLGDLNNKLLVGADALVTLEHYRPQNFIVPYLSTGISAHSIDGKLDMGMPVYGGFHVRLGEGAYLNLQTGYRQSATTNRTSWIHSLGLSTRFGGDAAESTSSLKPLPTPVVDNSAAEAAAAKAKAEAEAVAAKAKIEAEAAAAKAKAEADAAAARAKAEAAAAKAKADTEAAIRAKADAAAAKAKAEAEAAATKAKAEATTRDSDGDGVVDSQDKCPTVAGSPTNNGCPVEVTKEVKETMTTAMQNVQFETGKSALKNTSFSVLDQLASIMQQHPEYRLKIEGHTDNVGAEASNQRLSQARATTCLNYLVSKGISASRITATGFGSTRPVADNATKEGRDRNRRVEFIIH